MKKDEQVLCACRSSCDGVYRQKNLKRKRLAGTVMEFSECPAAYKEQKRGKSEKS